MSIMTDSPIRFPGLFGDWAFTASSTPSRANRCASVSIASATALGSLLSPPA